MLSERKARSGDNCCHHPRACLIDDLDGHGFGMALEDARTNFGYADAYEVENDFGSDDNTVVEPEPKYEGASIF